MPKPKDGNKKGGQQSNGKGKTFVSKAEQAKQAGQRRKDKKGKGKK